MGGGVIRRVTKWIFLGSSQVVFMNQMTTRVKTSQLGQSHLIPALGELQRVTLFNNLRAQVRANISWKQARWSRRTRATSKLTAHTATVHAKFFLLFLLLFLLFVCCCCCCFFFLLLFFAFFACLYGPSQRPSVHCGRFQFDNVQSYQVLSFTYKWVLGVWIWQ